MPPYSASPSSTSSPGSSSSDRATAFRPSVAFGANARFAGAAPDVRRRGVARAVVEQRREPPLEREELDRLPLELALQALVGLEHGPRARPERAVVQVDDVGIEEERDPSQLLTPPVNRRITVISVAGGYNGSGGHAAASSPVRAAELLRRRPRRRRVWRSAARRCFGKLGSHTTIQQVSPLARRRRRRTRRCRRSPTKGADARADLPAGRARASCRSPRRASRRRRPIRSASPSTPQTRAVARLRLRDRQGRPHRHELPRRPGREEGAGLVLGPGPARRRPSSARIRRPTSPS